LVDANRRLAELVGVREKNQLIGKSLLSFMTPDARARALEQSQNGFSCEGAPCAQELAFRRPDGSVVSVEMRGTRVDVGGKSHGLSIYRDITLRQRQEKERQGLEAKLLQAQKMEAVGQLAGGIAHDFNNILAVMMLQLNLLQITPAVTPDLLNETVADLLECARRAASLTRQLLLFSRRQAMTLARLDANALVVGVTNLLGRLLGEPIALVVEPNLEPLWISADASMIEQVVMNLCVNARDAMPKAGQLTISIAAVEIDAEQAKRNVNAVPGRFVCIRVMDTGDGMDAAVLQHVFEPFFTTKEVGKGTGLGLSIVHGIVTKHGGFVDVVSQIGRGTTFSVFLPRVEGLTLLPQASAALRLPGGNERILVVEDEEFVRRMAVRSLALLGYRVTEAANGHEALELWESQGGAFDLLLTDMVMPLGISGLELCTRLRQKNALLRVIIASGYSTELIQGDHASTERVTFLHKPYELEALAATVRACLDRPA
jgi:PAS domain S-box-containing protein